MITMPDLQTSDMRQLRRKKIPPSPLSNSFRRHWTRALKRRRTGVTGSADLHRQSVSDDDSEAEHVAALRGHQRKPAEVGHRRRT